MSTIKFCDMPLIFYCASLTGLFVPYDASCTNWNHFTAFFIPYLCVQILIFFHMRGVVLAHRSNLALNNFQIVKTFSSKINWYLSSTLVLFFIKMFQSLQFNPCSNSFINNFGFFLLFAHRITHNHQNPLKASNKHSNFANQWFEHGTK